MSREKPMVTTEDPLVLVCTESKNLFVGFYGGDRNGRILLRQCAQIVSIQDLIVDYALQLASLGPNEGTRPTHPFLEIPASRVELIIGCLPVRWVTYRAAAKL